MSALPTEEKRQFLVEHYLARVVAAGFEFVLTFALLDEGGHELILVFGTSHEQGVRKMKEAMWTVDQVGGEKFRDPLDPNQRSFDVFSTRADLAPLRRRILVELERGPRTLEALQRLALLETPYKDTHVRPAVKRLVADGEVEMTKARRDEDRIVSIAPQTLFP